MLHCSRRMTLAEQKRDLAEGEGTAVSARTEAKTPNGRIAARKPLVRKHAARRLMWAREHKEWGIPSGTKCSGWMKAPLNSLVANIERMSDVE